MPSPPPAPPLRKFTLHPPTLLAPASPLTLAHTTSQPFTTQSLTVLRTTLLSSRTLAAERIIVKDTNRRNLTERQALLNRVLEEAQKIKEAERRKKREEEERKDKERSSRLSNDKANDSMVLDEPPLSMGTAAVVKDVPRPVVVPIAPPTALPSNLNGEVASRIDPLASVKNRIASSSTGSTPLPTPTPSYVGSSNPPTAPGSIPASVANSISTVPSPLSAAMETSDEEDEFGQPKPPSRRRNNINDMKKRKRDQIIDSDNSGDDTAAATTEKHRKLSPHASRSNLTSATPQPTPPPGTIASTSTLQPRIRPTLSHLRQKLKTEPFIKHTIPTRQPAYGTASAFYIPPSTALIPALAPSVPNPSTPKRQGEVCEDFSKAKVGTQITFHTFHTWAESYLRVFGEDDLAFLARQGDDVAPYVVPPLGKYYQERWEEEDLETSSLNREVTHYLSSLVPAPLVRARPENLTEDSLGMENVYCGPSTERLISALQFTNEEGGDSQLLESGKGRRNGEDDGTGGLKNELDAIVLEERIKAELRFIGIIPAEEIDWSTREDDEITSSLRLCQAELAAQVSLNTSRKAILSSIVKDRMGYQDYEATRDAQERLIELGWSKRQKGTTKQKKIGRKDGSSRDHSRKDKSLDDGWEGKGPISLGLLGALLKREKLVGTFKPFFEDPSDVGRFFGIPEESVFAELEEES